MSIAPTPRVAALVLNYNGRDITLESIESLAAMSYPNLEIVHIDNGSSDGSSEAVAAAWPEVTQVRVEVNQGVVYGMNKGMRAALERGCDYLLLLNNDIEADPEMLTELMRVIESDSSIGCVGPKIYYHSDRNRLWSAGGYLQFRESATRERGLKEIDRGQYDRDEEVPYINGCAMLVPRRVVEEIGLWDPLFHLAADDADWCMRMRRAGYRCVYVHRAVLYHMVSPTLGGYTASRTYQNGRSLALFVRRYAGPWQWITFVAAITVAIPIAFLRELPSGNQAAALAKLKGVIEGLRVPLQPPPRLGDPLEHPG
jgi:GT2 family glycosyltransferase